MTTAVLHAELRRAERWRDPERGSTLPLIIGFWLLALLIVAGSITLGEVFVQQRDLQDMCDGAAAAAAASSADLDRSGPVAQADGLQFVDVQSAVTAYARRDPDRRHIHFAPRLSADRRTITIVCHESRNLALGQLFGRRSIEHTATSSARAAVLG